MKRLSKTLIALALSISLTLAAALAADARHFEVRMLNGHLFDPQKIEVQVGDTITWINQSAAKHSNTPDVDTPYEEVEVLAGKFSKRVEMTKEGTFPYTCKFHSNMKGEIKVIAK